MPSADHVLLMQALKGSPAACLLTLCLSPVPVTADWLSQVTGYCPNTITKALRRLEDIGLAAHNGRRSGWHTHLHLTRLDAAQPEPCTAQGSLEDPSPADLAESPPSSDPAAPRGARRPTHSRRPPPAASTAFPATSRRLHAPTAWINGMHLAAE